jgi:hypothetical protein
MPILRFLHRRVTGQLYCVCLACDQLPRPLSILPFLPGQPAFRQDVAPCSLPTSEYSLFGLCDMSQQPRPLSTHSTSPAKTSARRVPSSGSQHQQPATTTTAGARSLLPSPQFEDDPIVLSHQQHSSSKRPSLTLNDPSYSENAVAESEHCGGITQEPASLSSDRPQDALVPATFQPFFALIEDTVTNEHYHPTVHYIFADDDTDIITEAALRSLEILDPSQKQKGKEQASGHQSGTSTGGRSGDDSLNASRLPPPVAGTREHFIVLDVQPVSQTQPPQHPLAAASPSQHVPDDPVSTTTAHALGYEVTSAHSLSAEWAVLRTGISDAPTITDTEDNSDGLMLRIEGRGNTPADVVGRDIKGKDREKETETDKERESMEELIERFTRRLEDIRSVLDAGGGSYPKGAD